jgi:hypothetical protein
MPNLSSFPAILAFLLLEPLFSQMPPGPLILVMVLWIWGAFIAAGVLWVAALSAEKTWAVVYLLAALLCFWVGISAEHSAFAFFPPAIVLSIIAAFKRSKQRSVAVAYLIPIGLYTVLGFVTRPYSFSEPFIFFFLGLSLLVSIILKYHDKAMLATSLGLAALCWIYSVSMYWGNYIGPPRKARARWAADVASDPESLLAIYGFLRDQDLELLRKTTRLRRLELRYSLQAGEQLRYVIGLAQLQSLQLSGPCVDGTSLRHIAGLTQIQALDLNSCDNVSDDGIEHIAALTNLRELQLADTKVTDAGLRYLKALTQLQTLTLSSTQVTDAGLEHLARLTALRELDLNHTKITGAGLRHLKALTQLQKLGLSRTQISDAGLEHLQALSQLQTLDLGSTPITYAGLERLKALPKLASLNIISTTKITDDEARRLQEALPNCKIRK